MNNTANRQLAEAMGSRMGYLWVVLLGVILLAPVLALAQPPDEPDDPLESGQYLMRRYMDRRAEHLASVDLYVKRVADRGIPGLEANAITGAGKCSSFANCDVFKVDTVTLSDGTTESIRRETPLSPLEVSVLAGVNPTTAVLDDIGSGFITAQLGLNKSLGLASLSKTDLAENSPLPSWASAGNILAVTGFAILRLSSEIENAEASLANSAGLAQAEMIQIANALSKLEIVGLGDVNGIPAEIAVAENIDMPAQSVDGETFQLSRAVVWGDPTNLVLLKYRFEGTATAEGESREFYIEIENSDFRNPAGCGAMYEPYRTTMRMGGLLNEEQTAEMEQARAQLAEFDQQMASMPAQQRQMMERMMGQQMAMVRSLATSGAMEMVEQTEEILCNPDMASLYSLGGGTGTSLEALVGGSGGGSFASLSEQELLRQIQVDLTALGYMPGNTDGVLDTLTQIAISQFEAEQGLAVTGAPSVALAQLLADLTA